MEGMKKTNNGERLQIASKMFYMIKGILLGLQVIASGQFSVAAGHRRRLHDDAPQRNRGRGPLVARDRAGIALPMGKRLRHSGVSPVII